MSKPSVIVVSAEDLPLVCRGEGAENWNGHPRVFLVLNADHRTASCPYCGAVYRAEGEISAHH
ncbi:zinc-finger domain-containing protein [Stenoxybacter acetivorans]|uniref:zinc-finger domain-containing protein n=1 Tax=Stenoxybacter acetivorans TaxID=422441 RepID=UPI00056D413C|nr:zinc-finger domain-containing protein [Stenoxybacter acetivorans]